MTTNRTCRETVVLDGVSQTFFSSGTATVALRNVFLTGRLGELTLLLGRSGSGKTTLLSMVAGLYAPSSGSVQLFGRDLASYQSRELQQLRATSMGFVFQTFRLIESLSALQNVAMVLEFAGRSRFEAHHRARELLFQLGVGHLAKMRPGHFSQGEKQRVAIARAIANSPPLILADEPTACLESEQGLEIIRLLYEYASKGHGCVLVASHDQRLSECADRVFHLQDGTLIEVPPGRPVVSDACAAPLLGPRSVDHTSAESMGSS